MRTTTPTLDAAQASQVRRPISRLTVRDLRLRYSVLTDAATSFPENLYRYNVDAVVTAAGTIIRGALQAPGFACTQCRVTDPETAAQWDTWGNKGVINATRGMALWANGGSPTETIYCFTVESNVLKFWQSTDDGVSYAGPTTTLVTVGGSGRVAIAPISNTVVWVMYRDTTGADSYVIARIADPGAGFAATVMPWRWYGDTGVPDDAYVDQIQFFDAESVDGREVVMFSANHGEHQGIMLFTYENGTFNPMPIRLFSPADSGQNRVLGWRLSNIQGRLWLSGEYILNRPDGTAKHYAVAFYSDDGLNWAIGRDMYVGFLATGPADIHEPGKILVSGDYAYMCGRRRIFHAPATYLIDPAGDPAGKKIVLSPDDEPDLIDWDLNIPPGGATAATGTTTVANADHKYQSGQYRSVLRVGSEMWREMGYETSAGREYVMTARENIDSIPRTIADGQMALSVKSRDAALKRLRDWRALDFFDVSSQRLHFDDCDDLSKLSIVSGAPAAGEADGETYIWNTQGGSSAWLATTVLVGTDSFVIEGDFWLTSFNYPNYSGFAAYLQKTDDNNKRYVIAGYRPSWSGGLMTGFVFTITLVETVNGVQTYETISTVTDSVRVANGGWLRWECHGGARHTLWWKPYSGAAATATWHKEIDVTWSAAKTPWDSTTHEMPLGVILGPGVNAVNLRKLLVSDLRTDRTVESLIQEFGYKAGIEEFNFSSVYSGASVEITGASAGNWGNGAALVGIDHVNLDLEFDCPALADGERIGVSFRNSAATWPPANGYTLWLENSGGAYSLTLAKDDLAVVETYPAPHTLSGTFHFRLTVWDEYFVVYLNRTLVKTFRDTSNPYETNNQVVVNSYGANKTLTNVRMPELYERVDNALVDIDRDGVAAMEAIILDRPVVYFGQWDGKLRVSAFRAREDAGTYGDEIYVEQEEPTDFEVVSHLRLYAEDIIEDIDDALAVEHGLVSRPFQMPSLSTQDAQLEAGRLLSLAAEQFERRRVEMTGQLKPEVEDEITADFTTPSGVTVAETLVLTDMNIHYSNNDQNVALTIEAGARKKAV